MVVEPSMCVIQSIDLNSFEFVSEFTATDYIICNRLTHYCPDLSYVNKTKTLVVSDHSFCRLVEHTDQFLGDIAGLINKNSSQASTEVSRFFRNRNILIQQTGIQAHVYKVGTYFQTGGCATMVARTLSFTKMAGVSGLKIIESQPLLIIALPTVGAMFFHGCGSIIGNNTVGRTFNTIGNTLNLPMFFVESVYNTYASPVINRIFGIPTLLNYTKQALRGPGLDPSEATKFLSNIEKKSIMEHVKCYLITKLGGKC